jgi:hypothetical protein
MSCVILTGRLAQGWNPKLLSELTQGLLTSLGSFGVHDVKIDKMAII